MEDMHGQSIADMSRHASGGGKGSRAEWMRERFGDDFYLEDRSRKHRYVYISGSKSDRRRISGELMYPTKPYPKGDTRRYETAEPEFVQPLLFGDAA
jgi:hypothetical protein